MVARGILDAARQAVRTAFAIGLLATCTCTEDARVLIVDVRTDLIPGAEFSGVEVSVGGQTEQRLVSMGDDWHAGIRVARFVDPAGDPVTLSVRAIKDGSLVIARNASLRVAGNVGITITLTRTCAGITCPGPSDSPSASACIGGRCVDERCLTGTEPTCDIDSAECTDSSGCPSIGCANRVCEVGGFCFVSSTSCDEGICDPVSGMCVEMLEPDAGPMMDASVADASSDATAIPDVNETSVPDASMPDAIADDAAMDAAGDSATPDAGMDAATDAGMDDGSLPDTCVEDQPCNPGRTPMPCERFVTRCTPTVACISEPIPAAEQHVCNAAGGDTCDADDICDGVALTCANDRRITATVECTECGDGVCGLNEDCANCTADCGECCGGETCVFPGAVGFGVTTAAGRGSRVLVVRNLNDTGAGSLRAAISSSGPRTIVFEVGGTIQLETALNIRNGSVTIAGQTAPSPGITLQERRLGILTSDVLVQHLRVRLGDATGGEADSIIVSDDSRNVVIDHVSASWSIDENVSLTSGLIEDVTLSNMIIAEALHDSVHGSGPHSKGLQIGTNSHRIAVLRNLFAHNEDMQFASTFSGTTTYFANNISYNTARDNSFFFGGTSSGPIHGSVIGNVIIAGPSSPFFEQRLVINADMSGSFFVADNINLILDNISSTPIVGTPPAVPIAFTPIAASTVRAEVMAQVGARPTDRDPVDLRIIAEVEAGTGSVIDSQDDVGGYPTLTASSHTLELPSDPGGDDDSDGHTNLEEYLHMLAAHLEGRVTP